MASTSAKTEFNNLLYRLRIPNDLDTVFVLRNHVYVVTEARMSVAVSMVMEGHAQRLVMVYEPHTQREAAEATDLVLGMNIASMAVCTEAYHMPRAYLTFLKRLNFPGFEFGLYPLYTANVSVDSPTDEEAKIEEYQKRGHVASYEEGVDYLCSLLDRTSSNSAIT